MAINYGLGGPKAMAKAAADGQPVNIPALPYIFDGGTKHSRFCALMVWRPSITEGDIGKSVSHPLSSGPLKIEASWRFSSDKLTERASAKNF